MGENKYRVKDWNMKFIFSNGDFFIMIRLQLLDNICGQ